MRNPNHLRTMMWALVAVIAGGANWAKGIDSNQAPPASSWACECATNVSVEIHDHIPHPQGEGRVGAHGVVRCDEGRTVYVTDDTFTSVTTAQSALQARVSRKRKFTGVGMSQKVRKIERINAAYLIELAGSARVNDGPGVDARWVMAWLDGCTLWCAYSCDRSTVLKVYESQSAGM